MINKFKLAIGILLILLALYTGFTHKRYWSTGLVSLVFTLAYIHYKFKLWIDVYKKQEFHVTLLNFAKTYAIQFVGVSVFYFSAYGLSSAFFNASGFSYELRDIYLFSLIILLLLIILVVLELNNHSGQKKMSRPNIDDLLMEARRLEVRIVMSDDIIRIAREMSELENKEDVACKVKTDLLADNIMNRRRIGYNTYRNMATTHFESINIEQVLTEGLDDPHPWVQYDVLRAIEEIGINNTEISLKLQKIVEKQTSQSGAELKIKEISRRLLEKHQES